MLNCDKARQITASNQILCVKYGVAYNSSLTVYHILAILVYCSDINDGDKKQYQLTFDKLNKSETWQNVKLRHNKYAMWTKYLRECVELFGCYARDILKQNGISIMVYHVNYYSHPQSVSFVVQSVQPRNYQ